MIEWGDVDENGVTHIPLIGEIAVKRGSTVKAGHNRFLILDMSYKEVIAFGRETCSRCNNYINCNTNWFSHEVYRDGELVHDSNFYGDINEYHRTGEWNVRCSVIDKMPQRSYVYIGENIPMELENG